MTRLATGPAASLIASMLVAAACTNACGGDDATHHRLTTPAGGSAEVTTPAGSDAAPVVVVPAVTATGTTATLDESMTKAYFTGGEAGLGATAFAAGDWARAIAHFGAARTSAAPEVDVRLLAMIGLAEENKQDWPAATRDLLAARAAMPLLADFLGYHAARSAFFAHQPDVALPTAQSVARDSIVGADAELLVGDVLRGRGDKAAVATFYRDYLARRPKGPRRTEALFRIADADGVVTPTMAAGDPAAWKEGVELLRRITIEDPLSSWATQATAALTKVAPERGPASFTGSEAIERATELFDAMRNPESQAAFHDALTRTDLTPAQICLATYDEAQSMFKARNRTGAAPRFDDAAVACATAKDDDLTIKSYYQAGRSWAYLNDHQAAIARYQAAQKIDATHSYADDSLLREAEEWTSLGDDKQTEAVLGSLPDRFPTGDQRAEAMWRLGWQAWRKAQYPAAIGWWTKQIAAAPIDDNYFGEGQAQYWIGRAQDKLGKRKEALASWEAGVHTYPAAYYSMLGLNRIREADPARYATLVAELAADPKGFDPKAAAFTFKARVEYGTAGFARAMELLRLGLGDPAEDELRVLGLTAPSNKKRVDDPDAQEKLWAMAYLYDRAGRYATSHWPLRWHILDYRRAWPTGANRARWQIAYPKAYWALLSDHASRNGVPVAMQIAIVREESAFDPKLESYANAVGLTQMINSTATRFAKGTGIEPTRENLQDAEKNVTIGSRFLGFLFKNWNGFTLLVPPSYNAGEGGVRKMLKARGAWDADEFIEGIKDDQARNYSKRVLGTFFTYTWLYEGKVPEIPNRIPADLIPK